MVRADSWLFVGEILSFLLLAGSSLAALGKFFTTRYRWRDFGGIERVKWNSIF